MDTQIDDSSGIPPWRQLVDLLRQRIEGGEWDKKMLPAGHDLAAEYGVGLATLRKALDVLKDAGWIRSTRGYGTAVTKPEERRVIPGP